MTAKELISAVKTAREALDTALKSKQVADKELSDVQAIISDADELSTLTQKRHANTQGELNRVMSDPRSTVDEIKELRKSLKESETQQGDAVASFQSASRDLEQAGRNVVQAADNVVEVERNYWRSVWMREAHNAVEAASDHLKRAWGAALLSRDSQPGQFDSLLKRHFNEPDEVECRALAETMR